jgi:WD40 repeat protein
MNLEQLLAFIDTEVFTKTQRHLKDVEVMLLRGAYQGLSYEQISEENSYTANYLRQDVGPKLWKLLSEVFGEKVGKTDFKWIVEQKGNSFIAKNDRAKSESIESSEENIVKEDIFEIPELVGEQKRDWGEAVDVSIFYGRRAELNLLKQWIIVDRCRLIAILGMGGIGKTTLSVKLAEQIQHHFEYVIWRSLRNTPSIEEIVREAIAFLSDRQEIDLPETLDGKISRLIHYFRTSRCLLLLDNFESVLQGGTQAGIYNREFEGYGQLLRSVADVNHQSCVLISSREKPKGFAQREGANLPVRSLQLKGLNLEEGQEIFTAKNCFGADSQAWGEIVEHYGGNPLALKIVASAVQELAGGDVAQLMPYLQQGQLQFDDINDILERHFDRLTILERQVMYWLSINREPVSLAELSTDLVLEKIEGHLLDTVHSLVRRCLIEQTQQKFGLQPVVMEYITNYLVTVVCEEIASQKIDFFKQYALIKAQSKDYIRQAQVRFILQPVIEGLFNSLGSKQKIEFQLGAILTQLRENAPLQPGYAAGNILNLLRELKADLTNLDFSDLTVWQAYLVGANLEGINFAGADLARSVFTSVLNATLAVAFSPDGKLLAMANADNQIRIWQTADWKELLLLQGHRGWVCSVAFSPDSQALASGSFDRTIKLWNLKSGECVKTLPENRGWVWSVAFSPDGKILASSQSPANKDRENGIGLWKARTGEYIKTLAGHEGWIWSVTFSPEGHTLASGGDDRTLRLWQIKTGETIKIFQGHTNWIRAVSFSPDGQTLASGSHDSTVRLWDIATGECRQILKGHTHLVSSVAFSPQGKGILASGSSGNDRTIRLWDIATGKCRQILQGHPNGVWSVAFHPDGQTLVSGSNDSTVKLWNAKTGQSIRTLQGYSVGIRSLNFSPDGQLLVSGGDDCTVRLWNVASGECSQILAGHSSWVWCAVFSPDGQLLASSSSDTTIRLWNVTTGKQLKILRGHTNLVFSVSFNLTPFGGILASGSNDETIKIWDIQTGHCLQTLQDRGRVWSVAFSPIPYQGGFDRLLASGSDDRTVKLWDLASGNYIKALSGHDNFVFALSFSRDGKIIASGSEDTTVKLWDVKSGKCLRTLEGHTSTVSSLRFSYDDRILATSSFDRTVKLWDVCSGKCLTTLPTHSGEVWSIDFSPQNKNQKPQTILASSSQDGKILLWDVATQECLKILRYKLPYERMDITNAKGLTKAQKGALKALGAAEIGDRG